MEFIKKEKKKIEKINDLEQRMLNWPDCYYRERDAEAREQLLQTAEERNLTPEDNAFRRELFDLRYDTKRGPEGNRIDNFVKSWMDLRFLAEGKDGLIFKTSPKKLDKVMDSLGFSKAATRQQETLLYQELRHLGMLYIALCQEDKNYNSVLFGFGTISEEKQALKIASEIRRVGVTALERFDAEEKYRLFTNALKDAYCDMFPDYENVMK